MNQILAFWVHPRSISTGFERIFIEREDFKVLHEPFSALYYVYEKRVDCPGQHIDPNVPMSYPDIKNWIQRESEKSPVFFKDMCYHPFDHVIQDAAFIKRMTNTFLIRDPEKTVLSNYAMNPGVTSEEIGIELEYRLFMRVKEVTGQTPIVIDADELEDNPDGVTRAYCDAVGISFMPEAMHWEAGRHIKEWDSWKEWHVDATQSSGIQKNMESFDFGLDDKPRLREYYEYHLPFYEKLFAYRITAA
jgi:Sulfotransferase domain